MPLITVKSGLTSPGYNPPKPARNGQADSQLCTSIWLVSGSCKNSEDNLRRDLRRGRPSNTLLAISTNYRIGSIMVLTTIRRHYHSSPSSRPNQARSTYHLQGHPSTLNTIVSHTKMEITTSNLPFHSVLLKPPEEKAICIVSNRSSRMLLATCC